MARQQLSKCPEIIRLWPQNRAINFTLAGRDDIESAACFGEPVPRLVARAGGSLARGGWGGRERTSGRDFGRSDSRIRYLARGNTWRSSRLRRGARALAFEPIPDAESERLGDRA